MSPADTADCDYVIVGSGAGGGTLAARLAENGMKVVLLEAGGDPCDETEPGLPEQYEVPAFHAQASENPAMAWDFMVNHYADPAIAARDEKCSPEGILYPRASTLGGCTAHNAMIFMTAHDSDWDHLAELTGDPSWSARAMRKWTRLVEDCRHRPIWRFLRHFGIDPTGHGWNGWLRIERFEPQEAIGDRWLVWGMAASAWAALHNIFGWLGWLRLVIGKGDPNDARTDGKEGVCYTPLSTAGHRRVGARERVLDVAARHPKHLTIELHALATQIVFDGERAIGIEYLKGWRLYGASQNHAKAGERRRIIARREVIICGGTFNSPQLLMLSGIGPRAELEKLGIAVRVDLPGVGRNLQDRYEVGIIHKMKKDWAALDGATFAAGDPLFHRWQQGGHGLYGSNGAALAVMRQSRQSLRDPDLFMMAMVVKFKGYYEGYSDELYKDHDGLSWCVLKGHTRNRSGAVTLQSADPQQPPQIDFNYFGEGGEADLAALVEAVEMAREIAAPLRKRGIAIEELPGEHVRGPALAQWIRDNAWGHHASCTCAIGRREAGGVVDSDFRVHGVKGLRIVDASVFPRIPGFFIVSAVYMIAEKAASVILAEAAASAAFQQLTRAREGAVP
ncbi:MAG TPA: GMC family oxidoreductase [Dongiaceae bacterium]|jgi:choline dehydrogenase-like flavoprotein|nr:GMC family oxidoreductase [Dongiaceae bacterium]